MKSNRLLLALLPIIGTVYGCKPHDRVAPSAGIAQASPPRSLAAVRFELCSDGLPLSGMWKSDPAFADVNGDGHLDLAGLPRLGNGPRVWLGNSAGSWTESSQGLEYERSCGGGLEFGDVNNDGLLDLAVADHCQGLFVYLGDGAGHWTMVVKGVYPTELGGDPTMIAGAEDLALGDVNGDGNLDIVSGASDVGGINVYLGDGTGRGWTRLAGNLPSRTWANRVKLQDVNNDGTLDIIASYAEGPRIWLNNGQAVWTPALQGLPSPMMQGVYVSVEMGDFNNDGLLDLAAANWVDGPELYLQEQGGSWRKQPDLFPEILGGASALDIGDLDRDGHLDMVVAGRLRVEGGYVRGLFALYGDGAGGMRYAQPSGLPDTGLAATAGVTLADINRDGYPDVAAGSGLIVETATGRTEPIIPNRLIVWCTRPQSAD